MKATRVTLPEFQIISNPTINIAQVKRRRFNIIDRAIEDYQYYLICA